MKIIAIISLSSLLSLNVLAQEKQTGDKLKHSPEEMAEKRVQKLTPQLTLTTDQQSKLKDILTAEMKKREGEHAQHETDRKPRIEANKADISELDIQMKKVLTEEQFKKLQELRKNERENMRERRKQSQKDE